MINAHGLPAAVSHLLTTEFPRFFVQVALWAWDIVVDNCAICRNHIMDLCNLSPQTSDRLMIAVNEVVSSVLNIYHLWAPPACSCFVYGRVSDRTGDVF
jgi:hypothetical protein